MIFQWKLKVENFIFTQLNNLQLNLCWLFFLEGGWYTCKYVHARNTLCNLNYIKLNYLILVTTNSRISLDL